jgi:hypothetical protein
MRLFFFIFLFSIFLSAPVLAQEDVNELLRSECGLNDDGEIDVANGTICERDIAFGIVYEIFPSLVDELRPIWNLSFFDAVGNAPEEQVLMGEYHGDNVFLTMFDLFYSLVVVLIVIYFVLVLFHAGVRLFKGGDIISGGDRNDDAKTWSVGAIVGGGILLPYKSFFVGPMIVFSMAIFSLSMANLLTSVFYSANQSIFEDYSTPELMSLENVSNGEWERHNFMADSYYRYLTAMSLCQAETTSYKMSASSNYETVADYERRFSCEMGDNDNSVFMSDYWREDAEIPPFVWYSTSFTPNFGVGRYKYSSIDEVIFASRPQLSKACEIEEERPEGHSCGGVSVVSPNWTNNPLVALLDEPKALFDIVESMESQIKADMSGSQISSVVSSHWAELKSILRAALLEKAEDFIVDEDDNVLVAVDNEVMDTRAALQRVLADSARPHYQSASRMLHQAAMNALLFGSDFQYEQIHAVRSGSKKKGGNEPYLDGLDSHMSTARALAEWVRRGQCLDFQDGLENSKRTLDFLEGSETVLSSAAIARCLDIGGGEVLEYVEDKGDYGTEEYRQRALARFEEIKEDFGEAWEKQVNLLTEQRRGIERSFSDSVTDASLNRWWIDVRQKGYLAVADYLLNINQIIESYKNDVKQITNTYQFMKPQYDSKYVSFDSPKFDDTDAQYFPFSYAGDEIFNSTLPSFDKIDPLVSSGHWLLQREMLIRQKPLVYERGDLSNPSLSLDLTNFKLVEMFQLSETYFDRLGISLNYRDNQQEECLTDPEQCPFPLSDPLIELTLLGHDMVDAAVEFFSIALPVKVASKYLLENRNKKSEGSLSSAELEQLKGGMDGLGVVLFSLVDMASVGVDLLYDIVGPLMIGVLIMGAALAYLLPIIPKIYLYMKFVAWFMVVVMASFAILLWCIFYVRMREQQDIIRNAGLHFGIEILLSPTLASVTIIFAYYFFYLVAFAVGGTSLFLEGLPLFENQGIIRHYFDALFSLVLIFFIFIMGIRYVYQLMEDMMGELLTRLGVNHRAMDDKIGEFVKAMLFDKARRALDEGHAKTSQYGRRGYRNQLKARINEAQEGAAQFNAMYGGAGTNNNASPKNKEGGEA